MKDINIGRKISLKRKEKGVTQEELANFLKVSKAAISKWELGNSYPDITLLPLLAAYFDISIDELIGYEPQLVESDIKKLYRQLCENFSARPFMDVYEECKEYEKKYHSCWELQLHISLLYINHCNLAGDINEMNKILEHSIDILDRVKTTSDDIILSKRAVELQALAYLAVNKPNETIDLLEDFPKEKISSEILLATAHQMKGNTKRAMSLLQGNILENLIKIIESSAVLVTLYGNDEGRLKNCCEMIQSLDELFDITEIHNTALLKFHLTTSQAFMSVGNIEEVLKTLRKYVEICTTHKIFPIRIEESDFFNNLDDYFEYIEQSVESPRSENVIKDTLVQSIKNNPIFIPLHENIEYKELIRKLEKI